ncbi:LCP family protein [Hoyosella sp. G463]|uniref:LCP family protein n=1 Tax=Lolliginicoccus lacisalsi TaxID=2742202 RepID=A0A927PKG6_9ACTN|nr:LCP family protein [Lolliginicoccus lacisalsi]MBD8506000.1 LCP family protein [Lolliginicoccus lacisalsi]
MIRSRKGLAILAIALIVSAMAGALIARFALDRALGGFERIDGVFADLDEESRPPGPPANTDDDAPTFFLIMGTDARAAGPTTGDSATASEGSARTDTIMLARVDGSSDRTHLVSIPRDSWVDVPGHGMNKINAAYAFGGPSLLIQTVEQLTGIRLDHFAIVDFFGFEAVTDALGGVTVTVPFDTTYHGREFRAGPQRMDGEEALAYVRQRENLPRGDFDRVQLQQSYLAGMLRSVKEDVSLIDFTTARRFIDAVQESVTLDDTLTTPRMLQLAWQLRGIDTSSLVFLTAPYSGTGFEGDQSVVYFDLDAANGLWTGLVEGTVDARLGDYQQFLYTSN